MKMPSQIQEPDTATIATAVSALLMTVHLACAQPLQPEVLFSFTYNGPAYPHGSLIQGSDGNFYGTTAFAGNSHEGTVFRITTAGEWTMLASFNDTNGA